jgi:pimeloyl-ACP methyl ester carboxylesterase
MAQASPAALIAALQGMRERRDQSDLLPGIQVPVLAWGGSNDEITPPSEMRTWCEQIPTGVYRELPDVAHLSPWENPQAAAVLLGKFLEEIALGEKHA